MEQRPNIEYKTGAHREDKIGKGRFDLIEPGMLVRLAKKCEEGAIRYGANNWKKGLSNNSYWDSAFRHFTQARMGCKDEDHIIACIWNLMALIYNEEHGLGENISENN